MRAALILVAVVIASVSASRMLNRELDGKWESYKQEHSKKYGEEEEVMRRLRWERNIKLIEKHNAEADNGVHTYRLGLNKYADMTNEEFRAQLNGLRPNLNGERKFKGAQYQMSNSVNPASVDWRNKGYVTPVKDQGQCGSCWSFSATGSLEGQTFKKTGQLPSLSEQNLVDCSRSQGNMGCGGGLMDQAFTYVKVNNGIDSEASYPYEAVDNDCRFNAANVAAHDSGFVDIPSQNEAALTDAIANVGPISVAIDASHYTFQLYSSGIYNEPDCSPTFLDHGVLAVGYDSLNGQDYYIVKNSWGQSWGQQGYIWMSRNNNNQCGIATMSSYPVV